MRVTEIWSWIGLRDHKHIKSLKSSGRTVDLTLYYLFEFLDEIFARSALQRRSSLCCFTTFWTCFQTPVCNASRKICYSIGFLQVQSLPASMGLAVAEVFEVLLLFPRKWCAIIPSEYSNRTASELSLHSVMKAKYPATHLWTQLTSTFPTLAQLFCRLGSSCTKVLINKQLSPESKCRPGCRVNSRAQ